MSRLRTVGLVAGFDLYESLRSRKALALILIYVVIAIGGTALFSSLVNRLFAQIGEQLGPEMVDKLLESEEVVKLVTRLTGGDEVLARELLRIPPLALFYEWLITTFMPLIVVLSSADAISNEISTGSARFSLFRVDRAGWAYGKLVGQTLLMIVGILIGAVACWGMGMAQLDRIDATNSFYWLMRMSLRGAFYGFAYLGIALCASQLVRSNGAARGIALLLAFGASFVGGILAIPALVEKSPDLVNFAHKLFPNGHASSLFRPELSDRLVGMVALLAIGFAWFSLGYWRLSRRDA